MPAEVTQDDLKDTTTADAADSATVDDKAAPAGGEPKQGEDAAPKTALEAAQAVMAKGAKDAAGEKPQGETQPPAKDAADKAKPDADDDSTLPFKDHPRWKEMSSSNRILKVAKEKNEQAIAQMEPRVKAHDALLGFFDTNNLNQQDVAQGLTIMAAVRNDPAKAYELLAPIVEGLREMVGETIPADIKAKIDGGLIDEATGRELAKKRAEAGLAQSRATALEERTQREREERERQGEEGQISAIEVALNSWGDEWRKRDPDVAKKQPLLESMLEAAWARNPPRTPEEARRQADEVLASLETHTRAFRPAPTAKNGNLPVGGASTTTAAPVPQSSLEAAKLALRAAG